jgi:hypothetical protein
LKGSKPSTLSTTTNKRAAGQEYCFAYMPNFFIRERRVVRFVPRRAAAPSAPPTRPLHAVSTCMISLRCFLAYSSATLVFAHWRVCSFFSDLLKFMEGTWGVFLTRCFSEFRLGRLKRPAPRQEHGSLNKILKLTNVAGPLQVRESLHDSRRNRFDALLHLLRKLLDEIADEQRKVFSAALNGGYGSGRHSTGNIDHCETPCWLPCSQDRDSWRPPTGQNELQTRPGNGQ